MLCDLIAGTPEGLEQEGADVTPVLQAGSRHWVSRHKEFQGPATKRVDASQLVLGSFQAQGESEDKRMAGGAFTTWNNPGCQ